MAILLADLACEIQLLVFQHLYTIDDTHHLERTCKKSNAVFEANRYIIFQSIILQSPVYISDIKLCHFIDAIQDFVAKHPDPLQVIANPDSHVKCRPKMDKLADLLSVRQTRRFVSVCMVDDILARWSGLRLLVDICFEFDGKWPTNPFERNPVKKMVTAARSSASGGLSVCSPSAEWVARLYKAIVGVWLRQAILNFGNIMHWESAIALNVFRETDVLPLPGCSIRDMADLVKAWNILFVRLRKPPFQLGHPSVIRSVTQDDIPGIITILRPPDIANLLILSMDVSVPFPPDDTVFLANCGVSEFSSGGIWFSRIHHTEAPEEDGSYLENSLTPICEGLRKALWVMFDLTRLGRSSFGKERQRDPPFSHHALSIQMETWVAKVKSPDDLFARYLTNDQVVEDIIGKVFLRELLRRDLDPQVPFSTRTAIDWYYKFASLFRWVARRDFADADVEEILEILDSLDEVTMDAIDTSDELWSRSAEWYNTYH
ncbi:hypothetical protein EPUS_06242 [Endocarpon pusillum Z07020]|uniref:F-box domain-containing protein n=1 Tax=Endocarpon pusillum (strain Z07020 / HMAS-L-300199) TaxID=1263415 RepID=U1G9W4_ENDPU|nr:uncharacterized protein EPUS_06242 [Endocarpon pusillum Z07020]ERF68798.1 hypothetical protein EPUS_06242 [Endocarpon pusillum Z07020]